MPATIRTIRSSTDVSLPASKKNSVISGQLYTINLASQTNGTKYLEEPKKAHQKLPISCYMNDGVRIIDFIIGFQPDKGGKKKLEFTRFRQKFETSLKTDGLELEYEGKETSPDGKMAYIKVHATWEALARQAELDNLQMPIMLSDVAGKPTSYTNRILQKMFVRNPCRLQDEYLRPRKDYFTDAFERSREEAFIIEDHDTFFSSAQRAYLTWSIISGVTVKLAIKKKQNKIKKNQDPLQNGDAADYMQEAPDEPIIKSANIQYLLKEGVYLEVFPLHDGEWKDKIDLDYSTIPIDQWPMRKYLYEAWARPRQWRRYQPLDEIRNYYGEKVGLYFAWLGFYTEMLIIPSVVGVIIFIANVIAAPFSSYVKFFCDEKKEIFCRDCPSVTCPFVPSISICKTATLTRIFDNPGATAFAVFMAVWAVCFLEMWKRYQSELCARWDVSEHEFKKEQVRPDYMLSVSTTRVNPVTQQVEPYLPRNTWLKRLAASLASVLFFICVVCALLAAVMFYKIVGPMMWYGVLSYKDEHNRSRTSFNPTLLTSITASVINGIFIALMTKIYNRVAWKLTEMETPRTDEQFEDSYTYKVALFQFVNFYGALFYLSFVRGQFNPSPLDPGSGYTARCPPTGCLLDVTIQLAIIMTGKQVINNVFELGLPLLKNWWRSRKGRVQEVSSYTRWERDHDLSPPPPINLFGDYLEMLIQYGFVTFFVAAFPLAPLFALVNNVIEIRLDAYKTLTQERRSIPARANDLGPWYNLLNFFTKFAVITNAFIIALATNFIDNEVYKAYNKDPKTKGVDGDDFMQFTLVTVNTSDWCHGNTSIFDFTPTKTSCNELRMITSDNDTQFLVESCYVRDYRDPHRNYELTSKWYHVMLGKFLFVLVFEHFIFLLQAVLGYLIPDIPDHVTIRTEREEFLQRQSFKETEGLNNKDGIETIEEEADDVDSKWDLDQFKNGLPSDVALHKLNQQNELQRRRRKQPFFMTLAKKALFC